MVRKTFRSGDGFVGLLTDFDGVAEDPQASGDALQGRAEAASGANQIVHVVDCKAS